MSELNWVHLSILFILVSLLFNVLRSLIANQPVLTFLGRSALFFSMVCLITTLVIRSQNAEYFALSNMYESMMVLVILIHAGFLFLDRWFNLPAMGWPVSLMLLVAVVWDTSLPTEIRPLQAALQSYWRAIHVPIIIGSYAMFTLAFISSVIYLIKSWAGGNTQLDTVILGPTLATPSGTPSGNQIEESVGILNSRDAVANRQGNTGGFAQVNTAISGTDIYDEITYRCVAIGFPLLTIGIILGGMWANEAWGNYWSWDPKESMSLVTLLGYGVYLHMRVNGEHSAKTLATVSVIGFILMLVTYFGENLMGLGLHSYGKIG
ncbi:MAG: c-type cytochrome biogenesis protein CcsB [Cyanobacteria bacterium]|nr:c-type cytochrome biogenesis protein CcsB [Cyanobacteriota bacterium]